MSISKKRKNLLLGLTLLVLPTIAIVYPLLNYISEYYSLLFIDTSLLLFIFGGAMVGAYLLHGTRLRFFIVFGVLLVGLYFVYQSIVFFPFGEFDSYYIANRFRINAVLLALGWFSGYGIARWRYFLIFFSLTLLAISAIAIASVGIYDANRLAWLMAPPALYVFYAVFAKSLLDELRNQRRVHFGKMGIRVAVFCSMLFFIFWGSTQILGGKLVQLNEALVSQQGEDEGGTGGDEDSMMEESGSDSDSPNDNNQGPDGEDNRQFRLKDYVELRPRLRQSEELLFTAYIDNFFENEAPNPLYITLYHLNQYNESLERFEVDPEGPADDLFLPNPTLIPNYYIQYDSAVLVNDRMEQLINPVQTTIYINQLDPEVFVAPSTAFSCQPVSVEAAFREQYKFAYNIQSEVSALNSAYFVYNSTNPGLLAFQNERFELLRQARGYEETPEEYLAYYTQLPTGGLFDKISDLAGELTKDATSSIDKVLAVRDYFLSTDENGEPRFIYTLTPGSPTDPNIPDASLLSNFLFNTQKGYCTYFAAATLFMLRSQGIPTRMAVGFMTVDRSHNNPGWYWYYADQAHAWTQVYFPEYGWLDFDMTISNDDAQQSSQPDRTPPLPPVEPQFVAKGVIQEMDSSTQAMKLDVDLMVVKKTSIQLSEPQIFDVDASIAHVIAGYDTLAFEDLSVGDTAVVISFDLRLQDMPGKRSGESNQQLIDRLPEDIVIQEILINPEEEEDLLAEEEGVSIQEIINRWLFRVLLLLGVLLIVLLFAPLGHYLLLKSRLRGSKTPAQKAIALYPLVQFLMNQMGHGRGTMTPMSYAEKTVDPLLGTNFSQLMASYLKIKYSKEELTSVEQQLIDDFYGSFQTKFSTTFPTGRRFINFMKVNRWLYYLIHLNIS